jgi:DNA repair protein RadC
MERLLKVSEVRLVYENKIPYPERIQIKSSGDAKDIFMEYWDKETIGYTETVMLLLLNRANQAIGIMTISTGSTLGCIFDIKRILQIAIKANSSSVAVAHNHPSGNTKPSEADINITRKLSNALKTVDLNLLDHIIITEEGGYLSFADEGIL